MKIALALGGGAGLGWAHIGAIQALEARGCEIVAVAGTSIGAIAAVCLAAGRLNVLEDIARAANGRQVVRFLDFDPRRGSMLGGRAVQRQLRLHFGHEQLERLHIPVAVVAADLVSGEEVILTRGPVVESVFASIAIPGVFPPLQRGGQMLVDGGVVAPVPVRAARQISAAPVVAINLLGDYARRGEGHFAGRRMSPLRVGRASLSLITSHIAKLDLMLDPPDVLLTPALGHVDPGNFTRAAELIALGEDAVVQCWDQIAALAP
ncbi:patatin-like phospholipase family protein [Sandarakinorhabdus sp.]|uniref:patatin-like phospholipase family protein n=1 Tax=Sandarakinorhabdus sp. TaxID=1916663 RepID=UPI00286D7FBB|nr:patatin-like phospholipase family protein [Sandarakinorhabdus sp.]